MVTLLGLIGAGLLGLCCLPLVIRTMRDGHARGVDSWFLGLWLAGEIVMLFHVSLAGSTLPVVLNFLFNVAMVGVVGWYRWIR